jgi:hypothetical protein
MIPANDESQASAAAAIFSAICAIEGSRGHTCSREVEPSATGFDPLDFYCNNAGAPSTADLGAWVGNESL